MPHDLKIAMLLYATVTFYSISLSLALVKEDAAQRKSLICCLLPIVNTLSALYLTFLLTHKIVSSLCWRAAPVISDIEDKVEEVLQSNSSTLPRFYSILIEALRERPETFEVVSGTSRYYWVLDKTTKYVFTIYKELSLTFTEFDKVLCVGIGLERDNNDANSQLFDAVEELYKKEKANKQEEELNKLFVLYGTKENDNVAV